MLVTIKVPPSLKAPEIFTASFVSGECWTCTNVVLPAASVRLLPMVNAPSGLPGASAPPELTLTAPEMVPLPPSVPPEFTTTAPEPVPLPAEIDQQRAAGDEGDAGVSVGTR